MRADNGGLLWLRTHMVEYNPFKYRRVIRIQDTDATGAVYFANQLQIGLEAFEEFLSRRGFSLGKMIKQGDLFLPIVHVEADFLAPLAVGDVVEVTLDFQLGTTSLTHSSDLFKGELKVGTLSIVHVVYSPKTHSAVPIPDALRKLVE